MRGGGWDRAALWLHLTTLELKLEALVWALERRYRPDQPRAPRGTPIGGRWILDTGRTLDRIHVAVCRPLQRCEGFSAGCQNGGTFGSSGSVNVFGKRLCWDCAIKYLGIQNDTPSGQLDLIMKIDPDWRK